MEDVSTAFNVLVLDSSISVCFCRWWTLGIWRLWSWPRKLQWRNEEHTQAVW